MLACIAKMYYFCMQIYKIGYQIAPYNTQSAVH